MKSPGLFKTFAFALIAVGALSLNFWYENVAIAQDVVVDGQINLHYDKDTIVPQNGVIRFDESYIAAPDLKVVSAKDNLEYVVEMNGGHLWADFQSSNAKMNIVIGEVVLMPNGASFDLSFDGSKIDLAVYGGDLYVGFLDSENTELKDYQDWYSPLFVNNLLVPNSTKVTIPLSKLGEHLNVLLYTKLVKEFKYSAIPASSYKEEWIAKNLREDKKNRETLKHNYSSRVFSRGLKVVDGFFDKSLDGLQETFTFVPVQRESVLLSTLFDYLNDAIFYASSGDVKNSQKMLEGFYSKRRDLPASVSQSEEYYSKLDDYASALSVFAPGDDEYEIYKAMIARNFVEGRDARVVVNRLWLDVYKAIDVSGVQAEKALDFYYENFISTIGDKGGDTDNYLDYIAYQNQLFDTLFLRESLFYRDAYFEIKHLLEQELVSLYPDGQLKDELHAAFISQKIDFLKRLRKFFFEDKVEVLEASQILERLIEEVDDLMRDSSSDLAVSEFFESRLEDITDFWGYLNAPEYNNSKVYGLTQLERYNRYVEEKDVILSFVNLQNDVLGDDVELTVEDVENEIKKAFSKYPDVTDISLAEIKNTNQRYVPVEGVIGGFPFKADFDRDFESLKNVYVYAELVSTSPVKVENLLALLQDQFSDLADTGINVGEDFDEETNAQVIARIYIASQFADAGFMVEMNDVKTLNRGDAIYRLTNVVHKDYPKIKLTFDYVASGEKISNLVMDIYGTIKKQEDKYSIEELVDLIILEEKLHNKPAQTEKKSDKILR